MIFQLRLPELRVLDRMVNIITGWPPCDWLPNPPIFYFRTISECRLRSSHHLKSGVIGGKWLFSVELRGANTFIERLII